MNLTNGVGNIMEIIPPLLGTPILLELSEHTDPAAEPGRGTDATIVGSGGGYMTVLAQCLNRCKISHNAEF